VVSFFEPCASPFGVVTAGITLDLPFITNYRNDLTLLIQNGI
jgi:hypothetical protein